MTAKTRNVTDDGAVPDPSDTTGGRTLVVLCDGTGKQFGRNNTNVVRTYQRLDRHPERQVVLYDPGIGTFTPRWLERRLGDWLGQALSKAFGYGLRQNLEDSYRFLMATYRPGDTVILIGFSRGAFTVRCLAGLLTTCGLLSPHEGNLVPYAIRHYFRTWHDSSRRHRDLLEGFRQTFTRPCTPTAVGVWDTVNAYGRLTGARFPNATLHPCIPYAYQALALDEFRASFRPSPWNPPADGQTIRQLWFVGAHSDVGGGYREQALADIALVWLLEQLQPHGLRLRDDWRAGLEPDPEGRIHDETRKWRWRIANAVLALVGRTGERSVPGESGWHPSVRQRRDSVPDYTPGKR
jgi:uncharacterized protein (DUF2235 family)